MARIYLVDDHAMVRDGLRAVLESGGHQVIGENDNLTVALRQIQDLAPDVLLLDLHLGERSGLELLTEMQKRNVTTPTVVLTMSAQPRHVSEALRLGAVGYVLKGAQSSELLAAIGAAAKRELHMSSGVEIPTAQASQSDPLSSLSVRERQIAVMVTNGHSSSEIGKMLHLSPKTVDSYRSRLMGKLGTPDMAALIRFAIKNGLVDNDASP